MFVLSQQASLGAGSTAQRAVVPGQAGILDPDGAEAGYPCWRKHCLSALGSPRQPAAGKATKGPCRSNLWPRVNAPLSQPAIPRAPAFQTMWPCPVAAIRLRPKLPSPAAALAPTARSSDGPGTQRWIRETAFEEHGPPAWRSCFIRRGGHSLIEKPGSEGGKLLPSKSGSLN